MIGYWPTGILVYLAVILGGWGLSEFVAHVIWPTLLFILELFLTIGSGAAPW